jgi:parallel beta-helix repeat protein
MHDSIVRNNTIYNSPRGISISDSPNNEIYDNTIYNVAEGFHYVDGHTPKNKIYDNTIHEDEKYDDDDD